MLIRSNLLRVYLRKCLIFYKGKYLIVTFWFMK